MGISLTQLSTRLKVEAELGKNNSNRAYQKKLSKKIILVPKNLFQQNFLIKKNWVQNNSWYKKFYVQKDIGSEKKLHSK